MLNNIYKVLARAVRMAVKSHHLRWFIVAVLLLFLSIIAGVAALLYEMFA